MASSYSGYYLAQIFSMFVQYRCESLPAYPTKQDRTGVIGGVGFNNDLLVCSAGSKISIKKRNECYIYRAGVWSPTARSFQLKARGFESASFAFNQDQDAEGRALVTSSDEILTLTPAGWVTSDVRLPYDSKYGCAVTVNTSVVMIFHGVRGDVVSRDTYFYNTKTDTLTHGPRLLQARALLQCGRLIVPGSRDTYIVAAGGLDDDGDLTKSTEVLNLRTGTWTRTSDLPIRMGGGRLVEHPGGGLVLVGGKTTDCDNVCDVKNLFYFDDSFVWAKMDTPLKAPMDQQRLALMIPESIARCS